jgi:hypothetical protein
MAKREIDVLKGIESMLSQADPDGLNIEKLYETFPGQGYLVVGIIDKLRSLSGRYRLEFNEEGYDRKLRKKG